MKCKYCDAELVEGMPFCPACGKTQEEAPAAEETPAAETAAPEIKEGVKATPAKIALAVVAGVVVLAVLVALVVNGLAGSRVEPLSSTAAPTDGAAETVAATEGTIPPDGNPDDVTCKGTYTDTDENVIAAADTVVATMGGKELTVGELQIYYWAEVYSFLNTYGDYAIYLGLDFTQPLDKQACEMGETAMTWQQYFLSGAIDSWRSYQALALEAEEAGLELDEEFRGYLESMPTDLEEMAVSYGFENAAALIQANYGPAADMDSYNRYMDVYYNGYNYFSDVYDKIVPTEDEIEAYFSEHEAEYSESGVTKDSGKYYDVRHILILVEGGTTAEDGTTTYSDDEWAACEAEAQQILDQWLAGEASEESFADLAYEKSEDGGSNTNGGLYSYLTVDTNFVESFKNWYLDESRQPGDYGLVQSSYGYHIMYFSGSDDIWHTTAKEDLISDKVSTVVPDALEKYPAEIDYSAIKLAFVDLAS